MQAALTDAIDFADLTDFAPEVAEVAAPEDAWLARRMRGFGASEIGVVLAALGRLPIEELPEYAQRRAKPIRVKGFLGGVPRIWLEKAGLKKPHKTNAVADEGKLRERQLVETWRASLVDGLIEPARVVYAVDVLPMHALPLHDHEEPRLTCTPDVWAWDIFGDTVPIDAKCSAHRYVEVSVAHRWQLTVQMAVLGGARAMQLEGPEWSRTWGRDAREGLRLPPVTREVPRVESEIEAARQAARDGWAEVEAVRERWEAMR